MNYFVIILIVSIGLATAMPNNGNKTKNEIQQRGFFDFVKEKMQEHVWNQMVDREEIIEQGIQVAETIFMEATPIGRGIQIIDTVLPDLRDLE